MPVGGCTEHLLGAGRLSLRTGLTTLLSIVFAQGLVVGFVSIAGVALAPMPIALSAGLRGRAVVGAALRAAEIWYLKASQRVYLIAAEDQAWTSPVKCGVMGDDDGRVHPAARSTSPTRHDDPAPRIVSSRATMLVFVGRCRAGTRPMRVASRFNRMGRRVRDLNGFYGRHFRKVPAQRAHTQLVPLRHRRDSPPPDVWGDQAGARNRHRFRGLDRDRASCAAIAVLVKLSSPGPVLFRQHRSERTTSRSPSSSSGPCTPVTAKQTGRAHESRITRVGRLLRRFRLDELPQLWNVLRGQLSLVGPRPEQVALVADSRSRFGSTRLATPYVRGLTGGPRSTTATAARGRDARKLQYDLYYIRNQSLRLDLLIMARTAGGPSGLAPSVPGEAHL